MANQTKAQLTDELIRLRAHSDRIEIELAKSQERCTLLTKQLDRVVAQASAQLSASTRNVPAWRVAADHRRAMSKAYFKANPGAKSVTDEQLRDFEENFDAQTT